MPVKSQWTALLVVPLTAMSLGAGYALGTHAQSARTAPLAVSATPAKASLAADIAKAASSSPVVPTTAVCSTNAAMTANTIPNIVSQAEPGVVTIYTTIPGQVQTTPFGSQLSTPESGIGSGFVINSDGLILTNDHVVSGASSVKVRVNGYKQRFTGTVIGTDYSLDLALVKISTPKPLPALTLATGPDAPIGSWSIAIGAPEGLYNTVTVGVISAKGRSFTIGSRNYTDLLQTDTPINPGNSGGPLLNLCDQVVGINTAVNSSGQDLGFAIPIAKAESVLTSMTKQHLQGKGWLGVVITTDTATLAQQDNLPVSKGALVVAVEPESPASAAGIKAGDVILAANGKTVDTGGELASIIGAAHPGQTMKFTLVRGTQHITVTTVLETKPTTAS